jgi:hypothetical protein
MVALPPRMKYPFNAMCVFLPSYNVALAPHVLTPIAELKPVDVRCQVRSGSYKGVQRHLRGSFLFYSHLLYILTYFQTPGTLPTSPSGLLNAFCLPQPPTSTPLEIFSVDTDAADRRRDPVRLKTETPTTVGFLLYLVQHTHTTLPRTATHLVSRQNPIILGISRE